MDDAGGAFAMGATMGSLFHFLKGYRNSPAVSQVFNMSFNPHMQPYKNAYSTCRNTVIGVYDIYCLCAGIM